MDAPSDSEKLRMAEYRVYVVGRDGHFVGCEPLVCGDDVEVIEKVIPRRSCSIKLATLR
jgi:hypothetical protein